jgi:putative FmdB family regulatory protein
VPTYDYRCDQCERTFEVRHRISEAALTTCDRCGGPIHRLLAATPFILKGGGWYVTDYPSEGRKKGLESEKSATSASPSTSSSTSSATTTSSNSSASSSSAGDGAAPKPASTSSS